MRKSVAIALGFLVGVAIGMALGFMLPRVRRSLSQAGRKAIGREEVVRLQEEAATASTRAREAYERLPTT
jgi:hypothetical protein